MTTNHCRQWKRYCSEFGQICIDRDRRNNVRFIPVHTPHLSLDVTREQAVKGLKEWRRRARAHITKDRIVRQTRWVEKVVAHHGFDFKGIDYSLHAILTLWAMMADIPVPAGWATRQLKLWEMTCNGSAASSAEASAAPLDLAYAAFNAVVPALLRHGRIDSVCTTVDDTILVEVKFHDGRWAKLEISDADHIGASIPEGFVDFTVASLLVWVDQPMLPPTPP